MKKIALLFILTAFNVFSQSINDYKYVIVPTKFDALNDENKYNLNTSTKLLLEKYGFEVFMNNQDMPTDIANNRCKSLTADLVEESGIFITKLKLVLKDCKDNVVYETQVGKSREKKYNISYNQAFRDAAKSFETLNYKYNGENQMVSIKNEIQESKPFENNALPSENPEGFYFAQPTTNGYQVVDSEPKVIMRLLNTSQKDVFIAFKGDVQGTLLSKNGKWFFEYYEGTKLISESINLRF